MKDVAVICILFNPTEMNIEKWKKLASLCEDIIFVDNSTDVKLSRYLKQTSNYIELGENKGIAYAQNIGISTAKNLGYKYVIFFDQDSIFPIKLIENLKQEYEVLKERNINIGAIGPALIEINTGQLYKGSDSAITEAEKVDTIISSGMLTEMEVINKVGGMKDKLFIDLVDHEWCWRAGGGGYDIYRSNKVFMNHQVGKKSLSLFGIPILISAPFRYYYQYRNTIWLLKAKSTPKVWKKRAVIRKIVEFLIVPFKTDNPLLTWKYMLNGIKDGLKYKL